jgi:hypothetical protein
MKIFVSYSFRPENRWVDDLALPLLRCFGHEPITGRILDAGTIPDEVRKRMQQCRRVLCFVTRAQPRYDRNGAIVGYEPPDWVRDELMMARGAAQDALEFRQSEVSYAGASPFHAYIEFDTNDMPRLLLDLARRVAEWPVGPLQLRLSVPAAFRAEVEQATNARRLSARCIALDETGAEHSAEDLRVHLRDGQLIVPFWVKPHPNLSIEIEVNLGARRLACRGISPAVREAQLAPI